MSVKEEFLKWKEGSYQKTVSRFPERKEQFKTSYNDEVRPVYFPEDAVMNILRQ